MKPIDLKTAQQILDFSGGQAALKDLGTLQMEGTLELYNKIANPDTKFAYLADEVGMGKTYMALGVVALMRYFNPSLRVLYICPSANVQEKWIKEHRSFTTHNIIVSQYRIRTEQGKPAAPYIGCRNIAEMLHIASTGYYADIFVKKGSFSIPLGKEDTPEGWLAQCKIIKDKIPAWKWDDIVLKEKNDVKKQYAEALNYILPSFDLLIIDEAHNFKHNFDSSDRNKVLSRVLGFSDKDEGYIKRIDRALLLSATPYDRDIKQLQNQLNLVGKRNLLPEDIESNDKEKIVPLLKEFMVRRLNVLNINGTRHTRNMYRKEHRTGKTVEIQLSPEQKLVTALVQKKTGELMNHKGGNPAFQIGMMSAFESYAQSNQAEAVTFDGIEDTSQVNDAPDRHVIRHIVDSYKDSGLGKTLPHPKMDSVCLDMQDSLFSQARKKLVFVRRVKSVDEIKEKLDHHYNSWIKNYILGELKSFSHLEEIFSLLFTEYDEQSLYGDSNEINNEGYIDGEDGDAEDNQPPKNDTFFSWFFRGAINEKASAVLKSIDQKLTTPADIRKGLTAKNQIISLLMELNWARYICTQQGEPDLEEVISQYGEGIAANAGKFLISNIDTDYTDIYQACQLAFLEWYAKEHNTNFEYLFEFLKPRQKSEKDITIDTEALRANLRQDTIYTTLHDQRLSSAIFPLQAQAYALLTSGKTDKDTIHSLLDKLDVHSHLVSLCLRTGHGIIDLYLSRIKLGSDNLTTDTRLAWLEEFSSSLKSQIDNPQFSTYRELVGLSDQLDLIIKTNIPDIYTTDREGRRTEVSHQLNPISPVIGASGLLGGNRSAQARKFRMPGYPLALISTNVFQEGEDLHTFCDEVIHFGISGSPVEIDQKTGRVDRINSLSHRRLTHLTEDREESDLIQIYFPHIKESIEIIQVRAICENINKYINSLHEFGTQNNPGQNTITPDFNDKSKIPDQIWSFLKSPYAEKLRDQNTTQSRLDEVIRNSESTKEITGYIRNLVNKVCNHSVEDEVDVFKTSYYPLKDGINLEISLDSARSSGEIILKAFAVGKEYRVNEHNLKEWMAEMSWNTFHRTQAVIKAKGRYILKLNCEMLVGGEDITSQEDVDHFFDCFTKIHKADDYRLPTATKILDYCQRASGDSFMFNNKQLGVKVSYISKPDQMGLHFEFGQDETARKHFVEIYESEDYCIFISKAVTSEKLSEQPANKKDEFIIEHTWVRNNNIDVIEFLLDPDEGISGRAIHPISSMNWEEFIFCAYVLAIECDRLEYVFNTIDVI